MTMAARVTGFMAHLRLNGLAVGPAETAAALDYLAHRPWESVHGIRHGLRILLTGRKSEWQRFDELFEAWWLGRGRIRSGSAPDAVTGNPSRTTTRLWSGRAHGDVPTGGASTGDGLEGGSGDDEPQSRQLKTRLAASRAQPLRRVDLRHAVDPEQVARAEQLAYRLARAIRHRISRRYRFAHRGDRLDMRRTIRCNLGHGGEPVTLLERRRPERPVRVVMMLDVSGSMQPYSRFLLQFAKGMARAWDDSEVFLFHTRLVRVTGVLRERDAMLAMTRLSLMAQGFGGGTRMSDCLAVFNDHYARRTLNSRTVFMILSDGYDTGEPSEFVTQIRRLKRRVRRLVWLNPLLGWERYRPVNRTMRAALPFVDRFAAAHSLDALAAVEAELGKL
jgi:uncharacterized protein with von Willebrand factor type A (vWA) domain